MNKIAELFNSIIQILIAIFLLTGFTQCGTGPQTENDSGTFDFDIREMTDTDYPDNPDIGFRADDYSFDFFKSGEIKKTEKQNYALNFYLVNGDSITIKDADFQEFMPSIPNRFRKDSYATQIAVINQEWNRNQVHYHDSEFSSSDKEIVRVDLARNCLNAGLWEVIAYENQDGKVLPMSHGWFDFPQGLYAELFEQRNDTTYAAFSPSLKNWVDPKKKVIHSDLFGEIIDSTSVKFSDHSDEMYPLKGARLKKHKEVIHPESFKTMRDLQSDSTTFATFSAPGFYNRADPRTTQLGRIYNLTSVESLERKCGRDTCQELELNFLDKNNSRKTILRIGGLNLAELPVLQEAEANRGWKNSMGFSNHTFYESVAEHNESSSKTSPWFAYFSDSRNRWLDSHKIGIDGPVLFWDADTPNLLHVWLLSFERHAFVGHYEIQFNPAGKV